MLTEVGIPFEFHKIQLRFKVRGFTKLPLPRGSKRQLASLFINVIQLARSKADQRIKTDLIARRLPQLSLNGWHLQFRPTLQDSDDTLGAGGTHRQQTGLGAIGQAIHIGFRLLRHRDDFDLLPLSSLRLKPTEFQITFDLLIFVFPLFFGFWF